MVLRRVPTLQKPLEDAATHGAGQLDNAEIVGTVAE